MKLINQGAFLLLRREMRKQILFDLTNLIVCSYMKEQLIIHEGAIALT